MSDLIGWIKENKILVTLIVIIFIAFLYQTKIISFNFSPKAVTQASEYYKVTKVTDGDTIRLNMNGTDETVRLIGINPPEPVNLSEPVQCFGKEATARMKGLVDGQIVRLEYDDTQSLRDIYNRLLAYVYLEDGQMVNRKMIAEGYAYEYTYMTPYKYQKEFRDLQNLARISGRGLWAEDTCSGSKNIK